MEAGSRAVGSNATVTAMRPGLVVGLIALLAATSCDRRVEPFVPGEEPQQPDLAKIFPEGAERADQPIPELPAAPAGRAAPLVAANGAANGAPIEGTIELAPEIAASVPPGAVLFLIARGPNPGPPLAVKRVADPKFPLHFSIGPDDRMIQTIPFVGPMQITARVDGDGNATTRDPGDLSGASDSPHSPGDRGVALLIDQVL
jgi:hypothetical protein